MLGSLRMAAAQGQGWMCARAMVRRPAPVHPHPPNVTAARTRNFHQTRRCLKESTEDRYERMQRGGPISWTSLAAFVVAGAGLVYYFKEEKRRVKEAVTHAAKPIGVPRIGGPFELIDCKTGKTVTDKDFLGKWLLIYFGFTFCPDVCPDELNKITDVMTRLEATRVTKDKVIPVFITIDPKRDSVEVVREYVQEFHPGMVGLSGTKEEVEQVARAYRVHFSEGPPVEGNPMDYIGVHLGQPRVDHSIIEYLVDPQGVFQAFFGQNRNADEMAEDITKYIRNWKPRSPEELHERQNN